MNNLYKKCINDTEYQEIIKDIFQHEKVQYLKRYRQHCSTNRLEHSLNVSYLGYLIAKKYNLDYKSCSRAGLLHDMFLYDWRNKAETSILPRKHAFEHPKVAYETAKKYFDINDIEKDIIIKHMWPLTLAFPKYKESYIITFADKYTATYEFIIYLQKLLKNTYTFRKKVRK